MEESDSAFVIREDFYYSILVIRDDGGFFCEVGFLEAGGGGDGEEKYKSR